MKTRKTDNTIQKIWTIDGMTVEVEKKRIKNMYIRLVPPDGKVKLSVPKSMPEAAAKAFVRKRMPWILQKQEAMRKKNPLPHPKFVSGETHYLWGKPYTLLVNPEGSCDERTSAGSPRGGRKSLPAKTSVSIEGDAIVLRIADDTEATRAKAIKEWYRRELKKAIPNVAAACEKTVGKHASEWRVKDMKTRWGTCNIRDKRIWLNLQLAKKPPEALAYVATHELVHLYEKYHNAEFYRLMDRFCPNWKEIKKMYF